MKDLDKNGIVAIDFGTKSTTAIYMNKNGIYYLLSIGGDVDAVGLEKYENPMMIVEFRHKEKFLKAYNALTTALLQNITIWKWRMKPKRNLQTIRLRVMICIGFFLN
ncbi:hypothetical protein ID0444_03950 [Helicobacter pylori]